MIIGISGKKQSGKDTVGEIIKSLLQSSNLKQKYSKVEIKKFAAKVKEITSLLFSCDINDLENESFKNSILPKQWWYFKNIHTKEIVPYKHLKHKTIASLDLNNWVLVKPTYRRMMQKIGTDAGTGKIHPFLWVISTLQSYNNKNNEVWAITDVRFPDEVEAIRNLGGITIRLERNSNNKDTHLSETALDKYEGFDYIIDNNKSFSELTEQIKQILIKERLLTNE